MVTKESPDSPDVVRAKRLLDDLKGWGFEFVRTAPGADGPLLGRRITDRWMDTIYIEGFSHDCAAWRTRSSSLIVVGRASTERQIAGEAIAVLAEVLTWQTQP